MSSKLLLAEALETLKESARDEQDCDCLQQKYSESTKYRDQLPNLRRQYAAVFEKRLRGLEMLNHVRFLTEDIGVKKFCADAMEAGMDAAERVRDKETSILLPAGLVQGTFDIDSVVLVGDNGRRIASSNVRQTGNRSDGVLVTKDGYARLGDPLFAMGANGEETLAGSQPFRQEWRLSGGAYQISVINNDTYTVAAPIIEVAIQCESPATGQKMLYRKRLPAGCAWCRFIGVHTGTSVRLAMSSDAWMRSSRVRVELCRITKFRDALGNPISEEEAAAAAELAGGTSSLNFGGVAEAMPISPPQELSNGAGEGWDSTQRAMEIAAMARRAPATRKTAAGDGGDDSRAEPIDTEALPSWLAGVNVPRGYVGESAPMDALLAPATVVGPSSHADADVMVGVRAVAGGGSISSSACTSSTALSPSDAFAAANPNYSGPRVEISPLNCSPEERLRRIKNASWQWYDEPPHGFAAANYNQTESEANRELLSAIEGLVEPTPLGE